MEFNHVGFMPFSQRTKNETFFWMFLEQTYSSLRFLPCRDEGARKADTPLTARSIDCPVSHVAEAYHHILSDVGCKVEGHCYPIRPTWAVIVLAIWVLACQSWEVDSYVVASAWVPPRNTAQAAYQTSSN